MRQVRVVVVDDSATMRGIITSTLQRDPELLVVGECAEPMEARRAIKELAPDAVTLDIEMPNMNGLDFLDKIMRLRPIPVVMVSSLTSRGAEAAMTALELGAVDCVGKPTPDNPRAFDHLARIVKEAARARIRGGGPTRTVASKAEHAVSAFVPDGKIVAMGASTGGVEALLNVVSTFPENCPPTVITVHLPGLFTTSFANRLDKCCRPRVKEAENGERLKPGQVLIAPGSTAHLEVKNNSGSLVCTLRSGEAVSGHRPSVDALFHSVAKSAGRHAVGVILTGMGRDGAAGLQMMRTTGARTLGQDAESCVIYGMPRVAFENGAVERQVSLNQIGREILKLCSRSPDRN